MRLKYLHTETKEASSPKASQNSPNGPGMMLIYTNQNGLAAEKHHRSGMGLAADSKPVVKGKGDAACEESTFNEDMKRNEGDYSSATTIELLHWLQMWNYDDFDFEKIGEGFFGTVYKVTHKTTGAVLVLKELKSATEEEHKTMFTEEIKTLSRLCHPNVLKCEGLALHENNLCLLTEYIEGGSLDELLIKQSPLLSNWEARLTVAIEIARGMAYLHSQGVIHRDLASKNILIRKKENGRLQGIVADLGLSYTIAGVPLSEEEYELDTVGSPFHMAPEVLNHKPYNTKADVFSYGIILCEVITMCPGADPDDVPRTNDFGLAVEDFSEIASDCPSPLLDLTVRCCQMNPKERPTFDNIAKALDIMLDKLIESDEEILSDNSAEDIKLDYIIEESLICTCSGTESMHGDGHNGLNDHSLGVKTFKDRFGSVRKKASRRLLKRKLVRCPNCGGRVWRKQDLEQIADVPLEQNYFEENVSIDSFTTPIKEIQATPSATAEFSAGTFLNESHDYYAAELSQLAENTPGKLPKFFKNLLRSKRSKIRPEDVKRRWRKSFHDIFSNHQNEGSQKSGEQNGDIREEIPSPTLVPNERSKSPNKYDKVRRPSRFRRKSDHKLQVDARKLFDSSSCDEVEKVSPKTRSNNEVNSNGARHDPEGTPPHNRSSPVVSLRSRRDVNLGRTLAVSVDSLDKLGISDDNATEKATRNRRYSMPNRKPRRHSRAQSIEAPHPPLQKKTSGSSRIFSFLRKRSSEKSSPRE